MYIVLSSLNPFASLTDFAAGKTQAPRGLVRHTFTLTGLIGKAFVRLDDCPVLMAWRPSELKPEPFNKEFWGWMAVLFLSCLSVLC